MIHFAPKDFILLLFLIICNYIYLVRSQSLDPKDMEYNLAAGRQLYIFILDINISFC